MKPFARGNPGEPAQEVTQNPPMSFPKPSTSFPERLTANYERLTRWKEEQAQARAAKELEECSFKPAISARSRAIAHRRNRSIVR